MARSPSVTATPVARGDLGAPSLRTRKMNRDTRDATSATVFKDGERVKLSPGRFFWQWLSCGGLAAVAACLTMAVFAIVCSVSARELEPFFVVGAGPALLLPWLVHVWRVERRHRIYAAIAFSGDGIRYWDGPGQGCTVAWTSIDSLRDGFFSLTLEYKTDMGRQLLRMWHHRLWANGLAGFVLATIRERAELRCATRVHRWLDGLIWSPVVYHKCPHQPAETIPRSST